MNFFCILLDDIFWLGTAIPDRPPLRYLYFISLELTNELPHQTFIYFAPCKTPWMVKRLLLKTSSNSTLTCFSQRKSKGSWMSLNTFKFKCNPSHDWVVIVRDVCYRVYLHYLDGITIFRDVVYLISNYFVWFIRGWSLSIYPPFG